MNFSSNLTNAYAHSEFGFSKGAYLGMYAATGVSVAGFTFAMGFVAAIMGKRERERKHCMQH